MIRFSPFVLAAVLLVGPSVPAFGQLEPEDAGLMPLETEPEVALSRWAGPLQVPSRIGAHLGFLASDELGGRDTATVHGDITARYVASMFAAAGLDPAGDDGTYLQKYPLLRSSLVKDTASIVVTDERGRRVEFMAGDDFTVRGYDASGYDIEAPVVFAGHGIVDAEVGVDDYAMIDAEGRIVIVLDGRPDDRDELRRAAGWRGKRDAALANGAVGLITVTAENLGTSEQFMKYMRSLMDHGSMSLGGDQVAADAPFPRAYVEREVAEVLLGRGGSELAALFEQHKSLAGMGGFELPGIRVRLFAEVETESLHAANVAGLLRGTDPELAGEVLVLSAHIDHVGMEDGEIYNGADDNASGTTTILTVAEVLASTTAPRRSVLFLGVSGEEKGLLGSRWWVSHPTWELQDVVANINVDMVGRNDPSGVGVTPSPEHEQYNTLVEQAVELGPGSGLDVGYSAGEGKYNRRVDEYYERSDHANFARTGIPVVFFFAGEHADYHKPTDTLEKIDQRKVWKMVDLVARLIQTVGNADQRPYRLRE